MIERQQAVEKHQRAIGSSQVRISMFPDTFQLPHHVVSKIAHRASREWRQAAYNGGAMLTQQFLHMLEYVSPSTFAPGPPDQHNLIAARLQSHIGSSAEKGITPNLLSPF